jgi:hypothetical protein
VSLLALIVIFQVYLLLASRKHRSELITKTTNDASELKKLIEGLESRLQTISSDSSTQSEVRAICQDLQSKLEKWQESHAPPKIAETRDFDTRVERALSGIDFLVNHFKIATEVTKYGSLVGDTYDNLMTGVSEEFTALEQRTITGPEYFYRSNVLLFSLMMARVYMSVYGSSERLLELEKQIERAKKFV